MKKLPSPQAPMSDDGKVARTLNQFLGTYRKVTGRPLNSRDAPTVFDSLETLRPLLDAVGWKSDKLPGPDPTGLRVFALPVKDFVKIEHREAILRTWPKNPLVCDYGSPLVVPTESDLRGAETWREDRREHTGSVVYVGFIDREWLLARDKAREAWRLARDNERRLARSKWDAARDEYIATYGASWRRFLPPEWFK